jgi:hypothetical protein
MSAFFLTKFSFAERTVQPPASGAATTDGNRKFGDRRIAVTGSVSTSRCPAAHAPHVRSHKWLGWYRVGACHSIRHGDPAALLALDGISAELCILFANLERRLVIGAVVPLVQRFEAFPYLDRHSLRGVPASAPTAPWELGQIRRNATLSGRGASKASTRSAGASSSAVSNNRPFRAFTARSWSAGPATFDGPRVRRRTTIRSRRAGRRRAREACRP